MKRVSASVIESPWVEMLGWGHGVVLTQSDDDVHVVERLIAAHPSPQRCAVIMSWTTASRRRALRDRLAAIDIDLRPLSQEDLALMSFESDGVDKLRFVGVLVVAAPYRLVMRLCGRSTQIFQAVRRNS